MSSRVWVIGAVLAIVFANAGCVSCGHKSYGQTLDRGPECELPTACRGQVYLYMIHGVTPTTDCGLDTLRAKLAENGFAKVGVGELAALLCICDEIKSIHKCEPEAKFVLLGYDLGGAGAVYLARELSAKGIPVEAVVLLDPCGTPSDRCEFQTLLITSGASKYSALHTQRIVVPEANHFKLPAHPTTVATITDLLTGIATSYQEPFIDPVPQWSYKHAPAMRPVEMANGGEWDFLAEQGGSPPPIGTRVVTQPVATPTATARPSTSAGAVVIPK